MKLINFKKKIDFTYWGLLIFSIFPLIPNKIKGLSVILLFVFSLFNLKKPQFFWRDFFVNSGLYLVFLVSFLFFNQNEGESKQILETTLSILVIPLIFSLLIPDYRYTEKMKLKFMTVFITSTSIFVVVATLFIILDTETYYYSDWYINKARTLIETVPYIGQHPIYASIFSVVSILFLLELIDFTKTRFHFKNIFLLLCFITNTFFIILLSSRGVIISILLSLLFFAFFKIKKVKYKIYLALLFTGLIFSLFQYNRRMKELINFETYLKVDSNFSNSYRFQTYKCGYSLLKKNIFIGYGVGNVQLKLNECYKENNLSLMVDKYNSHNQYLDLLLKTGILGLFIFLLFLIYNVFKAIKFKNNLVLLILLFYSIVFLTENILLRQSGVILFYFLILFFNNFKPLSEKVNND